MIERLPFDDTSVYDAMEAGIHLNRYALAKPFCEGKKVLDAACGEGYGSFLMKKWGASHIDGVDIDAFAIAKATEYFEQDGIRFHQLDVQRLPFEDRSYDLVVSFETMEHVDSPELFLDELRRVLKPDGILILSCPNDPYYYENDQHENPFHKHTYTFFQFKTIAEKHLGYQVQYFLGFGVDGFCNIPLNKITLPPEAGTNVKSRQLLRDEMLRYSQGDNAFFLPPQNYSNYWNGSYYVGIWGNCNSAYDHSVVYFPRPIFVQRHDMDYDYIRHIKEIHRNQSQRIISGKNLEIDRLNIILALTISERDASREEMYSNWNYYQQAAKERDENWEHYQKTVNERDDHWSRYQAAARERDENWEHYQKALMEREENWAHYQNAARWRDELMQELESIKTSRSYRLLLLYRRIVGNKLRRIFSRN